MNNSDIFNLGKNEEQKAVEENEEQTSAVEEPEEDEDDSELANDVPKESELDLLKQRARLMGISFSNNISTETLAKRIQDKLDGEAAQQEEDDEEPSDDEEEKEEEEATAVVKEIPKITKKQKTMNLRQRLLQDAMKLVRVRITNLDPKKKDLPGEIITVANEYIGTVRKYVPFGEVTDNGYHVPNCIYKVLQKRKFLSIKVQKRNGREHVETQWAKEFSIDVLPPLTEAELARLAAAQTAKGGLE